MINFTDVEYSNRVNPIQAKYIDSLGQASGTAATLLESLQKGGDKKGGRSIFLLAAGVRSVSDLYGAGSDGNYWSSAQVQSYSYYAYSMNFISGTAGWVGLNNRRYVGCTVRPVSR